MISRQEIQQKQEYKPTRVMNNQRMHQDQFDLSLNQIRSSMTKAMNTEQNMSSQEFLLKQEYKLIAGMNTWQMPEFQLYSSAIRIRRPMTKAMCMK
jgi:hypothetical protein